MKSLIFVLLALVLFGCKKKNNEPDSPKQQTGPVSFTTIKRGKLSGSGAEGISQSNLVIDNNADWQALMTQMDIYNNISTTFSETEIDFDEYMVIASFFETKPNQWYLDIIEIFENEENLEVSLEVTETLANANSQAFHIVKIDKTTKPILFE